MCRYDVCVGGVGAAGSQVALHLARRGLSTIGIDRYRPPHALGSSHGDTRIIREAYFEHPLFVPLVRRAYELWTELQHAANIPLLRITGGLMVGADGGTLVSGALRSAVEHDLTHEVLSAAEIRARFPALVPSDSEIGVYEPGAGVLKAEQAIMATLQLAARAGVRLRFGEAILDWSADGDGVRVRLASDEVYCKHLVLTTGGWTPELVPELAGSLAVTRQTATWFSPADAEHQRRCRALPVFLWEWKPDWIFYGFPDEGNGVKVAQHHHGQRTSMEELDRAVHQRDLHEIRRVIAHRLPGANGRVRMSTVCAYTNTPDHLFAIGSLPDAPQVTVVSACSGHGFKFMPAVAEAVAAQLVGADQHVDLAPFSLARLMSAAIATSQDDL